MDAMIGNLDNLKPLGDGVGFTIVSDDEALCAQFQGVGLDARLWGPDLAIAEGAHVLLALCHQHLSQAMRYQFNEACALIVPVASFDPNPRAVMYTLRLLAATDFVETCRRNQEWVELLQSEPDGLLRFAGAKIELDCQLHDRLLVHTSLSLAIAPGEWVSVADYCEVSLSPPSQEEWCGLFTIDGYGEASGVLVAENSRVTPAGSERIVAARRLRDEFVDNGPVELVIESGVLQSVTVGGKDRCAEVLQVTNSDYGLHAIELGLGSNLGIGSLVDWSFNSQMNEGSAPLHLGFGDGITGAHMDFVFDHAALIS